jgi:hypothetical protein
MTATVRHVEVTRFVAAVREALQDLAPDEVDELTGGLEADLDDALADDSVGGIERFGSPEGRSAAGLPPRAEPGGRRGAAILVAALSTRLERLVQQERAALAEGRGYRWWPWLHDFAVTARPLWWAVRGWVGFGMLAGLSGWSYGGWMPVSFTGWVLLLLLVGLSVELGRRRVGDRSPGLRIALLGVNVVAVLLFLPLADQASRPWQGAAASPPQVTDVADARPAPNGLWLNGSEIRNVFPYDSSGRPLVDVQLFDDQGRSLDVGDSARAPAEVLDTNGSAVPVPGHEQDGLVLTTVPVPAVDGAGQALWNVFPLRQRSGDSADVMPVGQPTEPMPPFRTPLPVAPPTGALVTTGTPSASPSSQASPSPLASPSSQVSPSPAAIVSPTVG